MENDKLKESSTNQDIHQWNGFTTFEKANPVNKAKYETSIRTLETAGNILTAGLFYT
jgi:hypothetical protein